MKTLIKLLVTAAILFATWRVGHAYWTHYQFEDAVKEVAQFTDRGQADELPGKVLELAEQMDVPLDSERLTVNRDQRRVTIDATYVRQIEVLPRVSIDREFALHVSVIAIN